MTRKEKFEALRQAIYTQETESLIDAKTMDELIEFVDELQIDDKVEEDRFDWDSVPDGPLFGSRN